MMAPLLPAAFSDLEPFAERWSLASEPERYAMRLASSMEQMQALYDAALPRLADALAHLDRLDLSELPEPERRLLRLCFSVVMVSFPVEAWRQPHVPDSGAAYLDLVDEPVI